MWIQPRKKALPITSRLTVMVAYFSCPQPQPQPVLWDPSLFGHRLYDVTFNKAVFGTSYYLCPLQSVRLGGRQTRGAARRGRGTYRADSACMCAVCMCRSSVQCRSSLLISPGAKSRSWPEVGCLGVQCRWFHGVPGSRRVKARCGGDSGEGGWWISGWCCSCCCCPRYCFCRQCSRWRHQMVDIREVGCSWIAPKV